jgi:hypothetical protein
LTSLVWVPPSRNYFPLLCPAKVSYLEERAGRFAPVFEDTVRTIGMAWTLSILLLFGISGKAQARPPVAPPPLLQGQSAQDNAAGDEAAQRLAREAAKKANLQRQALLKADTDKLFKLATELKDSVDKSNENLLSLEVLKKAEEIEKLARSVKDKMKGPN